MDFSADTKFHQKVYTMEVFLRNVKNSSWRNNDARPGHFAGPSFTLLINQAELDVVS